MGTADDFLDRYAALPSAERNSGGDPVRPVPAMPELLLEQAEEALHRRVVRAAALGGLDWLH